MTRTLILFGAGPGIGNHVASEFASKGIDHIVLLARNTERLQNQDAPFVSRRNPDVKVSTLSVDLADISSMPGVIKELDSLTQGEDIEVIFFNAARIKPGKVLGVSVQEMEQDFRVRFFVFHLDTRLGPLPSPKLTTNLYKDTNTLALPRRSTLHPPSPIKPRSQTRLPSNILAPSLAPDTAASLPLLGKSKSEEYDGEFASGI
jgi:NAD(P)-dependent dehydrogenase (short-subunit alcohol dehydrogenase family)